MQQCTGLLKALSLPALLAGLAGVGTLLLVAPGQTVAHSSSTAPPLAINEVAWAGTAYSYADEWIELYNNGASAVDLTGWTLTDQDDIHVDLSGSIAAHGFFLLERSDDCAVSDLPADLVYTGNLSDGGEVLRLYDSAGTLVDSADGASGWPAGSGAPDRRSMERIASTLPDGAGNWIGNNSLIRNGLDCGGSPLCGTPRARNSASYADLSVAKVGPAAVLPGEALTYTIVLSNPGQLPALSAWLTDLLPAQVQFVAQDGPYTCTQPAPGTLLWDLGTVPTTTAASPVTFTVSGVVSESASGLLTNAITVTSATTESYPADNHAAAVTSVGGGPLTPALLVDAVYYDTYEPGDADEAFRIVNASLLSVDLSGWGVTDQESTAVFPAGTLLGPGQAVWCAREAAAFARQFGFSPDLEYGADTDPAVPDMLGGTPQFGPDDECILHDLHDVPVDALVYEGGNTGIAGWEGPSVQPWTAGGSFSSEGQVLNRKRDQSTGWPLADSDTAADWAQDPADPLLGRRVQYPGWDLDAFFFTERLTATATLTVAVAPDNLYEAVSALLASAQESIQIEGYTFRSRELADVLLERLAQGVTVTLLLEGNPPFEGVSDEEKWIAGRLSAAGAEVLFMVNNPGSGVYDRYDYQHSKFLIVDGATVLIGSENLNPTSLPADDKANGTAGRRGVYLITDAAGVVERAQAIWTADADAAHHLDLQGCEATGLCQPPPGFEPGWTPDWTTYTVQFEAAFTVSGPMAFEVIQSPESSLRTVDALLGLLAGAGPGDQILVEQFIEPPNWASSARGAAALVGGGVNPRLEAYLDAARRGAAVRILLDGLLDQDGDNAATVAYVQAVAQAEGLDLEARLGNPTGLGLHNKMVLARIGGQGYVHAGSLNGSEASSKVNRELALQVQSGAAHDYLAAVFGYDWGTSAPPAYLPLVIRTAHPPPVADQPVIAELFYDAAAEREWVEICNPTDESVDLSAFKIGDAAQPGDAEGMYEFPSGTSLGPRQILLVAVSAADFRQDFPGRSPDWEIEETDWTVPNLIRYGAWGDGSWSLRNAGDELLLLDPSDQAVDVLAYGSGSYPGVVPHPGVKSGGSLERYPAWRDSDDCSADFRENLTPSPGDLPGSLGIPISPDGRSVDSPQRMPTESIWRR